MSEAKFLEQVEELYWLLGHKVMHVTRRSKTTTDLIIKSNKGDRWIVRCEYIREVNESIVGNFTRLLQTENVKQAAIISAGNIKPEARLLVNNETIYLLDGAVFQDYLNRARGLVWNTVNPITLSIKRIVWRIARRYVQRTYHPLQLDSSSEKRALESPIPSRRYSITSDYPCPFCKRPVRTGLLAFHLRLECSEASRYILTAPPVSNPKRMFPEELMSPREEKVYTTDEHGIVISMEEYRELHKR